ncbi:glycosyltransferase [Desulfovibrio sp. OttesenSCG-928-G15]|nr:glycosyltransferase [Desulfovibrio sp. OttesenSCG-928-G15]
MSRNEAHATVRASGPRHFCTYFDHNYIPRALVTLESLHRYAPDALVHALCLTKDCRMGMEHLALPFVRLYDLVDLETADPELAAVKNTRSAVEYYFTLSPCLPRFLLTREGLDEVTYLDADMMFFSSPEPLFEEAAKASVIITPHRFSESLGPLRKKLEVYGLYNVSWLTFRNTGSGSACLEWYRAACLDWCFDRVEGDRFADQKYLDSFPRLFDGVHVMRHKGGGVAPWNLHDAQFEKRDGITLVDGEPLIFYHAQAFQPILGPFYASGGYAYALRPGRDQKECIFRPYIQAFDAASAKAARVGIVSQRAGARQLEKSGFRRQLRRVYKEFKHGSLVTRF